MANIPIAEGSESFEPRIPITFNGGEAAGFRCTQRAYGPKGSGDRVSKTYMVLVSDNVDPNEIMQNATKISVKELLERQIRYTALSRQSAFLSEGAHWQDNIPYSVTLSESKDTGLYNRFMTFAASSGVSADPSVYMREGPIDEGAVLGLAFVLASRHWQNAEPDEEYSMFMLQSDAEVLGVRVELHALRNAFTALTSRAMISRMLSEGYIEENALQDFFMQASRWEVELALESISVESKVLYVNPHAYSSDITAVGANKDGHVPDIRYLPYIFRAHLDFLQRLPEAIRPDRSVGLASISDGVIDLYNFASRVLSYYSPVTKEFRPTYDEVARVAEELSSQYSNLLAGFKANPTLLNKSLAPKRDAGVAPTRSSDVRDDIRKYGGKGHSRRRGTDSDLKRGIHGRDK